MREGWLSTDTSRVQVRTQGFDPVPGKWNRIEAQNANGTSIFVRLWWAFWSLSSAAFTYWMMPIYPIWWVTVILLMVGLMFTVAAGVAYGRWAALEEEDEANLWDFGAKR